MLRTTGIYKEFNSAGSIVPVLKNITLEIEQGTFASIVGQSGSGKTTLMTLLGALDKPTSGSIEVDGQAITALSDRQLISYRAKQIGFVFQSYNLVPNLSALENVTMVMEVSEIPRRMRRKRAKELLETVGINEEKQKRKPSRLSGGEQQRVAIARAIANKPKLILADEPTGNLDSKTGGMVIELLRGLAKDHGTSIVVVTHDESLARQTDKIFKLQDGQLTEVRNGEK
jgi:putative ABC transport system ATP-binding protein